MLISSKSSRYLLWVLLVRDYLKFVSQKVPKLLKNNVILFVVNDGNLIFMSFVFICVYQCFIGVLSVFYQCFIGVLFV